MSPTAHQDPFVPRVVIPRISKSTIGGRAFCYRVPLLWKNLPASVREADTLFTIKSRLRYPIVMNNASKPGTCRNIRHTYLSTILLYLAAVGYRQCMLYCVGGPYGSQVQHVARVAAVGSQLCTVVYPATLVILV